MSEFDFMREMEQRELPRVSEITKADRKRFSALKKQKDIFCHCSLLPARHVVGLCEAIRILKP